MTNPFVSKVDEKTRQGLGAHVAAMFNRCGALSVRTEPGSNIWTGGVGGFIISQAQNSTGRFANLGLEADYAHELVYPSGASYFKMWETLPPEEVDRILAENENRKREEVVSRGDMLAICSTGRGNGRIIRNFAEQVWELDSEQGGGLMDDCEDGLYHPFITAKDILDHLEDEPRKKGKKYPGRNDEMVKWDHNNPYSGKDTFNMFLSSRNITYNGIIFLPLGSRVAGRGAWWTNDRKKGIVKAQTTSAPTDAEIEGAAEAKL